MPLSYDFIEKPPQVQVIDKFFSGSAQALNDAYTTALELLENGKPLDETTADIARDGPGNLKDLKASDAGHFHEHWLDPGQDRKHPWSGPEVGNIMRRAYSYAIDRARGRDLPIETFWVFSPIEQFEMRVSESETQVTVFALIPKTGIEFSDEDAESSDRIQRFGPERAAV